MTNSKVKWVNIKWFILTLMGICVLGFSSMMVKLIHSKIYHIGLMICLGSLSILNIIAFLWVLTTKKYEFKIALKKDTKEG